MHHSEEKFQKKFPQTPPLRRLDTRALGAGPETQKENPGSASEQQ